MLNFFLSLPPASPLLQFPADFKSVSQPIVNASVEAYNRISEELLPTPAKSHYTFNLRDLSKVFQGLLMITPTSCPNKDTLLRLWLHESCRVFHDRWVHGSRLVLQYLSYVSVQQLCSDICLSAKYAIS